jgi:cyclic pyranopterin phosphate synthase
MRAGASDAELRNIIEHVWLKRADRYSEVRAQQAEPGEKIEMYYIGG